MPTPRAKFFRTLAYIWRGYANLAGVGVIACSAGLAIVNYVSGDDAVMVYLNLRDLPEKVPYKGTYTYVVDADVRESCPGEIVIVFSNKDPLQASFVTQRRPSALTDVRIYQDIKITNSLPPTVNPGKWHVASSRVSHCANRERVDPLTSYDIEVVP